MLHIGIAGVGGLGRMHLRHYLKRKDVHVVSLATLSGKISDGATNLGPSQESIVPAGAVVHAGYENVCDDPNVDMVSVNLPTDLHAAATIRALENGKHVFCEKPIALNTTDAQRMIDAAKAAGKLLMIGHCLRFFPEYVAADEIIRSGKHGKVLGASFTRSGGAPTWGSQGWFMKPERSGGAVIDLHIHDVDVALWWWGRPAKIEAAGSYPHIIYSRWQYADGHVAQFESAWDPATSAPFYYNFKILLESASLIFDTRTEKGLQLAADGKIESVALPQVHGHELEDHYFIDAILNGGNLDRCPPEAALAALECAVATAEQLERCQ